MMTRSHTSLLAASAPRVRSGGGGAAVDGTRRGPRPAVRGGGAPDRRRFVRDIFAAARRALRDRGRRARRLAACSRWSRPCCRSSVRSAMSALIGADGAPRRIGRGGAGARSADAGRRFHARDRERLDRHRRRQLRSALALRSRSGEPLRRGARDAPLAQSRAMPRRLLRLAAARSTARRSGSSRTRCWRTESGSLRRHRCADARARRRVRRTAARRSRASSRRRRWISARPGWSAGSWRPSPFVARRALIEDARAAASVRELRQRGAAVRARLAAPGGRAGRARRVRGEPAPRRARARDSPRIFAEVAFRAREAAPSPEPAT